jgi:LEA14-like dessication related protein
MRLLLFIATCLLSSCISYKPVMITGIKDVKTANISGESVELAFNLEIDNPNGFRIVLKQYDMDVMLNDKGLGKASSSEKIVIKRKSKETHPFKLSASYKDFIGATVSGLGALLNKEPVTFKVKGAIKGRIWWFKKSIPIETTQKIKL